MENKITKPSEVIYGTYATGKIKYFNVQDETKKIDLLEFKKYFYDLTWETIDEQTIYSQIKVANSKNKRKTKEVIELLFNTFDTKLIKYKFIKYVVIDRIDVPTAYRKAVDLYVDNHSEEIHKKFAENLDMLEMFIQEFTYRLMIRYEMSLVKRFLNRIRGKFILLVDEFKIEYLHNLPKNIQGIVCKSIMDKKLAFSLVHELELPLAIHDHHYKNNTLVTIDGVNDKVIANASEITKIVGMNVLKSRTYDIGEKPSYKPSLISGVAPFKTEFMFVTKGTVPTFEEQYKVFFDLYTAMKTKIVYIRIPDLRPGREIAYMGNVYTDPETFNIHWEIFQTFLKAIRKAAEDTNSEVNIVIPMVRVSDEMSFWRSAIDDVFYKSKIKKANVGIIFETESACEYFEDYFDMDFAMIELDDLVEEISDEFDRYSILTKNEVIDTFLPNLRDLHQYLRSYNIKVVHILSGNTLSNPQVFRKFLKLGFRDFSIPMSEIKLIENVIKQHNDSIGKKIGYAKQAAGKRNELRIKAILREKKEREKEQTRLKINQLKKEKKDQAYRDSRKEKRNKVLDKMLKENKENEKNSKINKKKNEMSK